ncbi:MAG: phosphosulfolactate synthase [Methanobacteriaceae archaeon]|nr:phosphosulfolactate synthase [Methanobacteriaceae archaeon]
MRAFDFLTQDRKPLPNTGITMILDKGLGPLAVKDILEISGNYVDLAKLGWGTCALHRKDIVKEKIEMYKSFDVKPYPGGTLLEVAYIQDKIDQFLQEAQEIGFEAIEISDGTIEISPEDRVEIIGKVKDLGFKVITEVGKKDPIKDKELELNRKVEMVNEDLDSGADWVLLEAREGGKGIGIYDEKGNVKEDEVQIFMDNTKPEIIIWEAPQKNQQVYFILNVGPNVNLGNIAPEEITSLETMRRGLRGDTLGKVKL